MAHGLEGEDELAEGARRGRVTRGVRVEEARLPPVGASYVFHGSASLDPKDLVRISAPPCHIREGCLTSSSAPATAVSSSSSSAADA